jgi:competence protein ComGC
MLDSVAAERALFKNTRMRYLAGIEAPSMKHPEHSGEKAFTFTELLVVLATVGVLILLPISALAISKSASARLECVSNLKQIGMAFRLWANNNDGRFPMRTAAKDGGPNFNGSAASSATYIAMGGTPATALWTMFSVMSNELSTPKILYCPAEYDSTVGQATVWRDTNNATTDFNNTSPTATTPNGNSRLSYFLGLDAHDSSPSMLLAGDHNIGPGIAGDPDSPPQTLWGWGSSSAITVSSASANATSTNLALVTAAWANNGHQKLGNIVLSDGSVERFNTAKLREGLSKTRDTTNPQNRLVFP